MLQWMGGSRRKVATSSKSTQKRQKQYFEQRKRQQQQHNTSGSENYIDKKAPYTQCNENNRSLDVLSLLNLSKNGKDPTSRFPEDVQGRGSSNGEHPTPNHQTVQCTKTIQMETENLCPSEHVEIREKRNASNHMEETIYRQDSHPDASRRNSAKDPIKMTTEYKLSVIDMLGDDEQNSSSRGNLVHEKHVAFSVEGLGKVEIETPVHSPQQPTRNFSYGWPAPSKILMGSHSSKNLKCSLEDKFHELDDMAVGVNASSIELPPYLEEPCRNMKHNTFVSRDCLLHDANDFFRNDEFDDGRVEHDSFLRDKKSSFLDHNFVDDNCGLSSKNWSRDLDFSMMNHMRSRNRYKPDFSFEGIHMLNKRASAKAADCFDVAGLSSSYKHQRQHSYDFMTREMADYSTWPSFSIQDTRDCLSFVSEDSCLSHAVWPEETKKPSFEFTERQKLRTHEADFRSPISNFSKKKNRLTQEFWLKESGICSRMHNKMPDFSTPGDDWLFEEEHNTENKKQCYASMNTSETQMGSPFGPFDSDFNPKFYADEKPSEHDAFSGNLFSDENINVKSGHHELFDGVSKEEKDSPKMQFQESVSTGETKSVTLPAISSTLHQRNYSSSEDGEPANTLESENIESENNHSYCEESNVKTPEMTPCPNAALSPLRSEGGSSSVEMPQKVEEYNVPKECANNAKTSLLSRSELKCAGPDRSCKVMMLGRFVLQLL